MWFRRLHRNRIARYTWRMDKTASEIIDSMGGTVAVAALCVCTKGAVSQWRKNGIPAAREQFLRIARPDAFERNPVADQKAA